MNQYALPASTIKAKSASRQLAKAKEAKKIGTSSSKSVEKQKVLDTEGADKLKKEQQIKTDLSQISNLTNNKRTDDSSVWSTINLIWFSFDEQAVYQTSFKLI